MIRSIPLLLLVATLFPPAIHPTVVEQKKPQQIAANSATTCDCSIYPFKPESCAKTCGRATGKVVSMTDKNITLEMLSSTNEKSTKSFKLDPSLTNQISLQQGTKTTLTYEKTGSDNVVKSVKVAANSN